MTDTYDIDPTDRMAMNRLRSAARRGDTKAKDTVTHLEQKAHEQDWADREQRRIDHETELEQRIKTRPRLVGTVMDNLRNGREAKQKSRSKA